MLDGDPLIIRLKPNAELPKKVLTTRPIPIHMKRAADDFVQKAIDIRIIVPVSSSEISSTISRGFFVPKSDGSVRLVVDLSAINAVVERPVHPFTAASDIIKLIEPDSRLFAHFDALHGYHQLLLDEESSKLTTFLLPSGCYRYLRAPMGLSASSDHWCYRSDQVVQGLPGVLKLVDDILVQAPTADELAKRIFGLLDRCRQHGLTLSKKRSKSDHASILPDTSSLPMASPRIRTSSPLCVIFPRRQM